jgi:hypothetical protein
MAQTMAGMTNDQMFALGNILSAWTQGYGQRQAARDYATNMYTRLSSMDKALNAERERQAAYEVAARQGLNNNIAIQGADARQQMENSRAVANARNDVLFGQAPPVTAAGGDEKTRAYEAERNLRGLDRAKLIGDALANIRAFSNMNTDRGFGMLANNRDIDQQQNFARGSKMALMNELGATNMFNPASSSGLLADFGGGLGDMMRTLALVDWEKRFPNRQPRTTTPSAVTNYNQYLPNVNLGQG